MLEIEGGKEKKRLARPTRQLVLRMEIEKCLDGVRRVRRVCGEKLSGMAR